MIVTDEGMQMDESDTHRANANRSMRASRDPASNVTEERPSQQEKQSSPRTSTDEEMQMDEINAHL
jgi:hypothetical protein